MKRDYKFSSPRSRPCQAPAVRSKRSSVSDPRPYPIAKAMVTCFRTAMAGSRPSSASCADNDDTFVMPSGATKALAQDTVRHVRPESIVTPGHS